MRPSGNFNVFSKRDLCGRPLSDVACHQCGGTLCNSKMGVIYDGRAMLFCAGKRATRELLNRKEG